MYFVLRYFLILIYVIKNLNGLIENITYSSIQWPFDFQFNQQINQQDNQLEKPDETNISNLISLYKDYNNNLIQIDDDLKYNRENEELEDKMNSRFNSTTATTINKSEFRSTIDPIVPIIKRMLRRKDIRKEYPSYEMKRRKGSNLYHSDETSRSSSAAASAANKVYNDEEDRASPTTYSDDEEEEDSYYEDENNGKKSLAYKGWDLKNAWDFGNAPHHHSLPPTHSLSSLHDHYFTGSSGMPSYWNHGHYYPYYTHHPLHSHHAGGHHYMGKYVGKHFYKEEYAIILVVISLAAFLGLIFALFMPYALIQSQAITGVPGNTVPYTNAVNALSGNQFSNAAISSDINRIPVFSTGKRRRKRAIRFVNQSNYLSNLNSQLNDDLKNLRNVFKKKFRIDENYFNLPLNRFIENVYNQNEILFNHHLFKLIVQSTFNLLNNLT